MNTKPRVVFVEDDAAVRRFVGIALEDLGIELVECTCVAEALHALAVAGARLLLTDLTLPGESGLALLNRLNREPALLGAARVAVFSAVVDPVVQDALEHLKVWRILPKPASLSALMACVRDALADDASATPAPAATPDPLAVDEADAIARHFEGNAQLYGDFRRVCLAQFALDVRAADKACDAADTQSLRRIAHSLKTVLHSLGHPALGSQARQIEEQTAGGDLVAAMPVWRALRAQLLVLSGSPP